jgi:hypothetical protein
MGTQVLSSYCLMIVGSTTGANAEIGSQLSVADRTGAFEVCAFFVFFRKLQPNAYQ